MNRTNNFSDEWWSDLYVLHKNVLNSVFIRGNFSMDVALKEVAALLKKKIFSLSISLWTNTFACKFVHIYWRNPYCRKIYFLCSEVNWKW